MHSSASIFEITAVWSNSRWDCETQQQVRDYKNIKALISAALQELVSTSSLRPLWREEESLHTVTIWARQKLGSEVRARCFTFSGTRLIMEHKQDERKVDLVSRSNQVQGGREWSDATEGHAGERRRFSSSNMFHVSRSSFKSTSKPATDKLLPLLFWFIVSKTTC